ncbi:MAG: mechanosensitive ion channel [Desulfatibacillum sp.]|nr:mechanosensitive ion channel [Desulfatibacillum sp.]
MDIDAILMKAQELVTLYGLKILAALLIFVLGRWVSKILRKMIVNLMAKAKVDATLVSFVGNISYIVLLAFVIVAALNQMGIQTTSFIAILGAAGLAVGLALQGSLSNFAAGVLMIIFRPFEVGHRIDGGGVSGIVEDIHIFTTQLRTVDNKTVIVPNSVLTGDNIINYSAKKTMRVDFVIGVSYDADVDHAKQVLMDEILKDTRVLKDPAVFVGLLELADSSVNWVVRPWVKTEDYWNVYFDYMENIKKRLDAEGIGIPYPQRDVHLYQHPPV